MRIEAVLPGHQARQQACALRELYSTQLQHLYVKSGWLEQPAGSVFRRPRGTLSWWQVVISLQTILNYSPLVVSGRSALELQG
ncbi:hypothetical protein GPL17_27005 [Bradyrhizobium yuanmingense]|nr:AbiEi antitoxin N-terminal domain-containing protein [Bradyrhizobium yuanmingense]MDF0522812.1 AbiEi antitoxin N-terminal domain-containing protein [Bradyrhizobium yuanmingense]MVT54119.1 hypothetical protein [Bradyrhizobium yuanmingense]